MEENKLSSQFISDSCKRIEEYLTKNNIDKKEILRTTLMAEEIMLHYQDNFGEECKVDVSLDSHFGKKRIRIEIESPKLNPFSEDNENAIINSLGAGTVERNRKWRYCATANVVVLTVEKKRKISSIFKIFAGVIIALVLGFSLKGFLGAERYSELINSYILPIANSYTGILCVMAILMIFFSIPLGIVYFENSSAFHKSAKRIFFTYITCIAVFVLLIGGGSIPFLDFASGYGVQSETIKSGFDVIIGFLPNNILSPFVNFNCVQVLIIGAMFGFSFLKMGEESAPLVTAFNKCNLVAVLSNNYLAKFIPIYVGLMTMRFIDTSDLSYLSLLIKIAPITIGAGLFLVLLFGFACVIKLKVSPKVLFKKLLPAFVINLSSASVGASFIDFYNELALDCGVTHPYTAVSCNLGCVFFKPLYAIFLSVMAIAMAYLTGVEVSVTWMVMVVLLSVLLSIAIPNIQNGATSLIVLLFSQLGLSEASANAAVSIDAILQFAIVPVNIFCLQCVTLLLANVERQIDLDKLRKPLSSKK